MNDVMILPALGPGERETIIPYIRRESVAAAEPTPVSAEESRPQAVAQARRPMFLRRAGLTWLAVAATIVVATSVLIVQMTSQTPAGATVAGSADALFDSGNLDASRGASVATGKRFSLAGGCLELRFGGGADVVIQGPATFSVTSSVAMALTSGRLRATASGAAHGFVVDTPGTRVTDLGTEFGVNVTSAGATEVHVFQGQVSVTENRRADASSPPPQSPTILSAGQAAVVANGSVAVSPGGATPQAFVGSLSTAPSIDVVDLICGGNGTMHLRSGAIDQRTGDSGLLDPVMGASRESPKYHRVPRLPVIDGCFIPRGHTTVDSSGHVFDFGKTSGSSFYQIRAGGTFPWPRQVRSSPASCGALITRSRETALS